MTVTLTCWERGRPSSVRAGPGDLLPLPELGSEDSLPPVSPSDEVNARDDRWRRACTGAPSVPVGAKALGTGLPPRSEASSSTSTMVDTPDPLRRPCGLLEARGGPSSLDVRACRRPYRPSESEVSVVLPLWPLGAAGRSTCTPLGVTVHALSLMTSSCSATVLHEEVLEAL